MELGNWTSIPTWQQQHSINWCSDSLTEVVSTRVEQEADLPLSPRGSEMARDGTSWYPTFPGMMATELGGNWIHSDLAATKRNRWDKAVLELHFSIPNTGVSGSQQGAEILPPPGTKRWYKLILCLHTGPSGMLNFHLHPRQHAKTKRDDFLLKKIKIQNLTS